MSASNKTSDDRLLGELLRRGQDSSGAAETEPSEDLFELFVEGRLPAEDEDEFYRYLDAHPEARRAASLYLTQLSLESEDADDAPPPEERVTPASAERRVWAPSPRVMTFAAMAACLLLVVSLLPFAGREGRMVARLAAAEDALQRGKFDEAAGLLGEDAFATDEGRLLAARAQLRETDALTDSGPWSLLDYGYGVDESVVMDGAPPAEEIARLELAGEFVGDLEDSAATESALAAAWIALKQNDPDAAIASLDTVLSLDDANSAAHLARGVAAFMAFDFESAAASFRRHLELEPASFAGRLNLAKTLVELGDLSGAAERLRSIPAADAPSPEIAEQITAEADRLDTLARGEE
ncbi:MAG: tetratricopeptide repeat protein [Planctomycetota bacterium]